MAVENGTGQTGLGARADDALSGLGYSVVGTATNADRNDYTVTEVRYVSGAETKARFLLSEMGGAGKVVAIDKGSVPSGADVLLVLGRDYRGLSHAAATTSPTTSRSAGRTPQSTAKASPSILGRGVGATGGRLLIRSP